MCSSRQKSARERGVDKPASHTGLPASSLVAQWMASKITWNGAVAEATRMGRTYQVLRCGEIRFSADSPAAFSDGAMLLETPVVSVSRREELPAPIVIPREQHVLARELQRELKRVGCYKGPLNGTWTPPTRRAMAKLIERVNARLPTAEPDAALYALTRAQSLDVCGSCPTGQSFNVQGRCTPAAL